MPKHAVCSRAAADVAHADKQDRAGRCQNKVPSIGAVAVAVAVAVSISGGKGRLKSMLAPQGASSQAAYWLGSRPIGGAVRNPPEKTVQRIVPQNSRVPRLSKRDTRTKLPK